MFIFTRFECSVHFHSFRVYSTFSLAKFLNTNWACIAAFLRSFTKSDWDSIKELKLHSKRVKTQSTLKTSDQENYTRNEWEEKLHSKRAKMKTDLFSGWVSLIFALIAFSFSLDSWIASLSFCLLSSRSFSSSSWRFWDSLISKNYTRGKNYTRNKQARRTAPYLRWKWSLLKVHTLRFWNRWPHHCPITYRPVGVPAIVDINTDR